MRKLIYLWILVLCAGGSKGQGLAIELALLSGHWPSRWISASAAAQREYGVYHFRKSFKLVKVPATFVVHVTADNRYRLFVNGQPVSSGPASSDLLHWNFETLDIAPYLKSGENLIAAQVWNMGTLARVGQMSNQTGFVLQANSPEQAVVNSDTTWKVMQDLAYSPCSLDNKERLQAYMVAGPGDRVDAAQYPWGWEQPGFADPDWKNAVVVSRPVPIGYGTGNVWTLVPRNIPLFMEKRSDFISMLGADGVAFESDSFLRKKIAPHVQPHQKLKILFDHKVNCVAYPELLVSGGKGSVIKVSYAEALVDSAGNKGNRDQTLSKHLVGNYDIFLPDGGQKRLFRPLWIRAYRYVELEITTGIEPLDLEDFYGMTTGYPLEQRADFACSDSSLTKIWDTGWRTAQLCAGEVYYDTPYYEQLQYTGDSRIQSLISLYNSGDDRLMRKSILDFYYSRTAEGLTQSRYPSNELQIIPTFSLFWVSMVHDYWMHRKDDAFVRQFLPAISEILYWYQYRVDPKTGMLGGMKWWNFIDWDNFNGWGIAPGAENGNSAIISMQAAYTFNQAAELFLAFGKAADAQEFRITAQCLNRATYKACFDATRGLFADTPEKLTYSQHGSIWGVLSGAVLGAEAKRVMSRVLSDTSIGQVTFFYRFYLTQALKKAGMGDLYYGQLGPWRGMLDLGLTTFAEKPEPTRSDCHAWSASPNYDFLSTICGIMPASPGFSTVRIAPAMASLSWIKGSIPHPNGMISVYLKKQQEDTVIQGSVILPPGLYGVFNWKGKEIKLHPGEQMIKL